MNITNTNTVLMATASGSLVVLLSLPGITMRLMFPSNELWSWKGPGQERAQGGNMAWVGLEIPLATDEELAQNPPSNVEIGTENIGGHLVLKTKAVEALRNANQKIAADFWDSLGVGTYLRFAQDVCEKID